MDQQFAGLMDKNRWPAKASFPIAQPGLKFIFAAIVVMVVFFYLGWMIPAGLSAAFLIFVAWFFRDPERAVPAETTALISPADGKVIIIDDAIDCEYLDAPCRKISIFMNVFNVHVNRIPYDGIIKKVMYHPGKFMNASFDKASIHNERNALVIETENKGQFAVVQIAGLIARRIVNCVSEGERITKGDRYGMIQFGSRLDLYLPRDFRVNVKLGDKTLAGSTIIGYMPE
jgi:phosphatidylserine decarboxylase